MSSLRAMAICQKYFGNHVILSQSRSGEEVENVKVYGRTDDDDGRTTNGAL